MLQAKSHVQTLMQRIILVHSDENSPIQKARQRTAFPPNFIHCLDSSHMMLTAIECSKAGETPSLLLLCEAALHGPATTAAQCTGLPLFGF